jgi:transcriptional regulator with XRE-family HTH domain
MGVRPKPESPAARRGRRFRERREVLGLTLTDLAYLSGLDRGTIWRAEHGLVKPTPGTVLLLRVALGLSTADLEAVDDPEESEGA